MRDLRQAYAALALLCACSEDGAGETDGLASATAGETDVDTGPSDTDSETESDSTGELPEAPTVIPTNVAVENVVGWCTALAAEERLIAVGPNAELWVANDNELGSTVRILSEAETTGTFDTVGSVVTASALDGVRGSFTTPAGLFTVDGPRVDALVWPGDPASIVEVCGDLSVDGDGRVLADDIYTRDLGQWWRWHAPQGATGPSATRASGVCADREDTTFVLQETQVWRIRPDFVSTVPELAGATALAADEVFGLAALRDGDLWLRPDDSPTSWLRFDAGPTEAIAASDGLLFVETVGHLYGRDEGETFELVDADGPLADAVLLGAAAGQVIVQRGDDLCVHGFVEPFSIRGVRPFQRVRQSVLDVIISTDDLTTTLDDVTLEPAVSDGEATLSLEVADQGWHTLEVATATATRTIVFEVERLVPATFTADIAPLFEAHCGGASCHGPTPSSADRPDLSSYESWVQRAEAIRERVAVTTDMPPPGSGNEPWGVEETLLLLGWLDAGLPEGE